MVKCYEFLDRLGYGGWWGGVEVSGVETGRSRL